MMSVWPARWAGIAEMVGVDDGLDGDVVADGDGVERVTASHHMRDVGACRRGKRKDASEQGKPQGHEVCL